MRTVVLFLILVSVSACGQSPERDPAQEKSAETAPVPTRDPALTQATAEFGPLRVRAGEFTAEAARKPWSAWWYPTRETYLFREADGELSPLQKYDAYVKKVTNQESGAAQYEERYLYDPGASSWEGRCDAWAVASIMEAEPVVAVQRQGIRFGVGDQKALLVKKYEKFHDARIFGQRYNGDRQSVFDDLYADQFHLLLQQQLFERERAFIVDKDPGVAVWNTPIWKAQLRLEEDPADSHVVHVTAWLFGASPFVQSYDYVGTLSVVFEYTYDLHGSWQPDASFLVTHGEWTGASMDYHPDFFTVLPDAGQAESLNKELDLMLVDRIVRGN